MLALKISRFAFNTILASVMLATSYPVTAWAHNAETTTLTVFAAASLKNALDGAASAYTVRWVA